MCSLYAAAQRRAEVEQRCQLLEYYASNRRPWLEWITFTIALIAAILFALRPFCTAIPFFNEHGRLLWGIYLVALFAFAGDYNITRLMERFVAQKRAWQLFLVVLLPVASRILAILLAIVLKR